MSDKLRASQERRRLVRDIGPVEAAHPRYPRVVGKGSNDCTGGRQAHVVLGQEGAPEGFDGASLGAATGRASEGGEQFRGVDVVEQSGKLCDDGRALIYRPGGGNISGNHGKEQSSYRLEAVRCYNTWRPRFFYKGIISESYLGVKEKDERTPPISYRVVRNRADALAQFTEEAQSWSGDTL